jgi:CRP-like cAMP-binding protein
MSWPADTVRELIQKNPKLGVALTQLLANRCRDLAERVATLSADSTARRLAKALFEVSFRMGQPDPEAREARRLPPLSHKLLAQYIGTRREAVTHCMNRFRREGLVSYSRRGLVVYTKELQEWLNLPSPVEESTPEATMPPGGPEQHHWNDSASI